MSYLPHTAPQVSAMLARMGLSAVEDLLTDIPPALRLKGIEGLPAPVSDESMLLREIADRLREDTRALELKTFLGAGAYDHFIPAVVDALSSRGEFFTAYTPYQPEVSQGTLEAIFEFQSMVCELYGMDVCNASLYDGATALSEAVLMAARAFPGRPRVLVSAGVHPEYRQTLATFGAGLQLETLPLAPDGTTDAERLAALLDERVCAVVVQSPNFYGCIEPMRALAPAAKRFEALYIAVCSPLPLALLATPGESGADIAVGDGQPLGNPLGFGGPHLGLFTCRREQMRRMPGRVVGQACDLDGRRSYVMTLRAREQDIRREKATSNICSNQALMALRACIYLSWMGKTGLQALARLNYSRAHALHEKLLRLPGVQAPYAAPFFNEFTVRLPGPADGFCRAMRRKGLVPGYRAGLADGQADDRLLVAVTEKRTAEDIAQYVRAARAALKKSSPAPEVSR